MSADKRQDMMHGAHERCTLRDCTVSRPPRRWDPGAFSALTVIYNLSGWGHRVRDQLRAWVVRVSASWRGAATSGPRVAAGDHSFAGRALVAIVLSGIVLGAGAEKAPAIFRDADLDLGKRLIVENQCDSCHQKKFGGDGTAVYRPGERITAAGFLRGMVEQCNTQLGMQLFPEEVTAIAAELNRRFYHFR